MLVAVNNVTIWPSPILIPTLNVMCCTTKFMVPNITLSLSRFFYFGLILVTAPNMILCWQRFFVVAFAPWLPNAFPSSLFISPLSDHIVFEISTDGGWHNPSGTSYDSRGDTLEQSCFDIGNSKTRRTLRQLLTIIGGARGVMVIVVGNGRGDTSSNPGRDWSYFTLH